MNETPMYEISHVSASKLALHQRAIPNGFKGNEGIKCQHFRA
jgi:hypothetical protein